MLTEKVINQLTTTDIYQSQTITMVISDSTQESLLTYFEKKTKKNEFPHKVAVLAESAT